MGAERRLKGRQDLGGTMPVQIHDAATGDALVARVEDVSSEGLGIITAAALAPGRRLTFQTLDGSYDFVVAWCRGAGPRQFKCGLRLAQAGADLDRLFSHLVAQKAG